MKISDNLFVCDKCWKLKIRVDKAKDSGWEIKLHHQFCPNCRPKNPPAGRQVPWDGPQIFTPQAPRPRYSTIAEGE